MPGTELREDLEVVTDLSPVVGTDSGGKTAVRAEERIAESVRRALESVGIGVRGVEVTDYNPQVFGNHVARVETADGTIEAIFDRQYELDLLESRIDPGRAPEIKRALAAEFSAAVRAGL